MSKSYKKQSEPLVFKNTRTRSYDRTERKNLNQQIRTMKYNNSMIDPDDDYEDEDEYDEDEYDEDEYDEEDEDYDEDDEE